MRRSAIVLTTLALIGVSPAAFAHPGHLIGSGFTTGLLHPFTGLDHLLAMTAVGLWAAQRGGRYLVVIPVSFIVVMALGAIAGTYGIAVPLVEPGILGSLFVFGLLIALDARLPLAAGITVVGTFAFFHGYTHAVEMPPHASLAFYGSGMLLGAVTLHLVGIGLGRLGKVKIDQVRKRIASGLATLAGIALFVGQTTVGRRIR